MRCAIPELSEQLPLAHKLSALAPRRCLQTTLHETLTLAYSSLLWSIMQIRMLPPECWGSSGCAVQAGLLPMETAMLAITSSTYAPHPAALQRD